MILLCLSFFPLSQDASPPVGYMDIFNSSTRKFITSLEFSRAPSSSTFRRFHRYFSLFSVARMKGMMQKCDFLDAVVNTNRIIVFAQTTVSVEVNPHMGVTF